MTTLFNDIDLFHSGKLRIQQFVIPDAELTLWEHHFNRDDSDNFYKALLNETPWKQQEITIYDKPHLVPRLSVWYGKDRDASKPIRPVTPVLDTIKKRVEATTGVRFTSVLANLYRDGKDGVSWHRDHDRELGPRPIVASVSFGETRLFEIRHKFRKELDKISIPLTHGSLLLMGGKMQHYWEHQVPKTSRIIKPRINLTFRIVY